MKGRVLDTTKRHIDKINKDVWDVNVESEGKTTKYQCWAAQIAELHGKEIEFTVKPAPEGTTYLPTLELPKGDGSGGFKKQGYKSSPEQLAVMQESYRKDLCIKSYDVSMFLGNMHQDKLTGENVMKEAAIIYKKMCDMVFNLEKKGE